jgi:serine protease
VISVSAVGLDGSKAPYANFGVFIDIAAPGGNLRQDINGDGLGDGVLSTIADDSSGTRQPAYAFYDGTSMAAPHVAGVLALMKAVYPLLSPDDVEALLQSGQMTIDLGTPGRDDIYGHGLVDALKAVQAAQELATGGTTGAVIANPSRADFGVGLTSIEVELIGLGSNPPRVVNFSATAPWLTVTAASVDSNGFGTYTFTVDRSGLAEATYTTEVLFNLSDGAQQGVPASMLVTTAGVTVGDTGHLFILLLQADTFTVVDLVDQDPINGGYTYTFVETPPGAYVIVAGTDLDNDGFICGIGETCGGYPNFNELAEVMVSVDDIAGLDFVAAAVSGLSTQMAVVSSIHRLPPRKSNEVEKALRP